MEKWENLEVYRKLPPEEVPIRFKEFANIIVNELYGFKLKESNTVKKLYLLNDEFELSIQFDNYSRWAKNNMDIKIYVCIKPLYSGKELLYRIFQAFEVDSSFKMFYPLTQEHTLLANSIIQKIKKNILPFFEMFYTSKKIITQHKQLREYYKIPNSDTIPLNIELRRLIYECAFRQRDKELFYQLNAEYLAERSMVQKRLKEDDAFHQINHELIQYFEKQQQIFDNNDLFIKEIELQNEKSREYIESLTKRKSK
jgi:hypothetical protein